MGRKENRKMLRTIKHLQKTKPWELKTMIQDQYGRDVIDNRMNKEVFAPDNKVMLDLEKLSKDPDWDKFRPEYKEFVKANADKVFTLTDKASQKGPFALVSFVEDETDPKNLFFVGHLKKVKEVKND